jgi:hypothetical protein
MQQHQITWLLLFLLCGVSLVGAFFANSNRFEREVVRISQQRDSDDYSALSAVLCVNVYFVVVALSLLLLVETIGTHRHAILDFDAVKSLGLILISSSYSGLFIARHPPSTVFRNASLVLACLLLARLFAFEFTDDDATCVDGERAVRIESSLREIIEPILNFVYEAYDDRKEVLCRVPKAKQRSRH